MIWFGNVAKIQNRFLHMPSKNISQETKDGKTLMISASGSWWRSVRTKELRHLASIAKFYGFACDGNLQFVQHTMIFSKNHGMLIFYKFCQQFLYKFCHFFYKFLQLFTIFYISYRHQNAMFNSFQFQTLHSISIIMRFRFCSLPV